RFITHLQYFAQRLLRKEIVDSGDDFLYEQVQIKYPEAFKCTKKIDAYLINTHHTELTRDERVYLTIHIYRVTERNTIIKEE
ncbi:TPA: PRD domain-containing protein, partial [Listeria monocytogenes]